MERCKNQVGIFVKKFQDQTRREEMQGDGGMYLELHNSQAHSKVGWTKRGKIQTQL